MTVTIPCELYSSKNSRQIFKNKKTGKFFPVMSKKAMGNESALKGLLLQAKRKMLAMKMMAGDPPWIVELKIYRKKRGRFDYVNVVQQLFDCMVGVGILPDDSADYVIPSFLPYEVDSKNPRVEITIKRAR